MFCSERTTTTTTINLKHVISLLTLLIVMGVDGTNQYLLTIVFKLFTHFTVNNVDLLVLLTVLFETAVIITVFELEFDM